MFDTMTLTKIGGGFLGAFLIFLLGGWAASGLYSTESHGGHGDEHVPGYSIEVASGDAGSAEAAPEVPFEEVYATADAAAGERLFRQCAACHSLDAGRNGVGPSLHGVVGRPVASEAGFGYSDAMQAHGGDWTPEEIYHFIESPRTYIEGTAMSFNGIADAEDRANLIAYLASIGN